MRMFVKSVISSQDFEFRFRCIGLGGDERDAVRKIDRRVYSFESLAGGRGFLTLSVEVPFLELCPIISGVKIITKEFGRTYGEFEESPLKRCMKVRERFSFSGTDFEYIQYIASALASAESYNGVFRALIVAQKEYFDRVGMLIPQDARRSEDGQIVLWDTQGLYTRVETILT
jgi:hypothetical protein